MLLLALAATPARAQGFGGFGFPGYGPGMGFPVGVYPGFPYTVAGVGYGQPFYYGGYPGYGLANPTAIAAAESYNPLFNVGLSPLAVQTVLMERSLFGNYTGPFPAASSGYGYGAYSSGYSTGAYTPSYGTGAYTPVYGTGAFSR